MSQSLSWCLPHHCLAMHLPFHSPERRMATVYFVEIEHHTLQFLSESPPSHLLELYFTLLERHMLVHEQMHHNLLSYCLVERHALCFPFFPHEKPDSNKHKVVWCLQPPCKPQISTCIFLLIPRDTAKCLASQPWHPKTPSLVEEDDNNLYEIMNTKKHFTIHRRICQSRPFRQSGPVLHGQSIHNLAWRRAVQ